MSEAYRKVTAALESRRAKRSGNDWQCPAHDDGSASLSVHAGKDKVLVHCHAGCSVEEVAGALNLTMGDLFDSERLNTIEDAVYPYVSEDGTSLFEVVRFWPKSFRQRRPDGTWSLNGIRRVPYRLPALAQAVRDGRTVYVVEGEKDVHAIERAGGVATCNPGGAGKWRDEFSVYFQDANVVVVADADEPGAKHAQQVASSMDGHARSVKIVSPKAGKDAADHIAMGYGLDQWAEFVPPKEPLHAVDSSTIVWRKASDREPKRMAFAWDCRIVLNSFNLAPVGEEGIGKGLLQARLASAATHGALMDRPVRVGIAPTEEDPDAALIPRLIAAEADLEMVSVRDQGSLKLPVGIPNLEEWIRAEGIEWLFLDTVNGHFGEDKNFNYAQPVESTINALAAMAARCGVTICGSLHTNRGGSVIARERYAHQLQFRRSARSSIILGRTEHDDDHERTIVHDKHNYSAKALALKAELVKVPVMVGGETVEIPRLTIIGNTDATAEELFLGDADRDAAITRAREGGFKRDRCAEEIRRKWEQMGRPAELDRASFSFLDQTYETTLIGRARNKLGVKAEPVKNERGLTAGWIWRFPA